MTVFIGVIVKGGLALTFGDFDFGEACFFLVLGFSSDSLLVSASSSFAFLIRALLSQGLLVGPFSPIYFHSRTLGFTLRFVISNSNVLSCFLFSKITRNSNIHNKIQYFFKISSVIIINSHKNCFEIHSGKFIQMGSDQ